MPVVLLLVLAVAIGCSPEKPADPPASSLPLPANAVARVGDRLITVEALEAELIRNRSHRDSAAAREAALEELLNRQTILSRALKEGLLEDSKVASAIDDLLVSEYLNRHLPEEMPVPSESAIEGYYAAHRAEFTTAAAIRFGVLMLKGGFPDAEPLREEALKRDEAGFKQLVVLHSLDQATRYRGGDAGWFRQTDTHSRWVPQIMAAAWALEKPGDVAPLLDVGDHIFIVRLLAQESERVKPLAEVRESIRHTLSRQLAKSRESDFYRDLRAGISVEINQSALETVSVPQVITSNVTPPAQPR